MQGEVKPEKALGGRDRGLTVAHYPSPPSTCLCKAPFQKLVLSFLAGGVQSGEYCSPGVSWRKTQPGHLWIQCPTMCDYSGEYRPGSQVPGLVSAAHRLSGHGVPWEPPSLHWCTCERLPPNPQTHTAFHPKWTASGRAPRVCEQVAFGFLSQSKGLRHHRFLSPQGGGEMSMGAPLVLCRTLSAFPSHAVYMPLNGGKTGFPLTPEMRGLSRGCLVSSPLL